MDVRLFLLLCVCGPALAQDILPDGPVDALVGKDVTFKTFLKNPEFTVIVWSFNDGTALTPIVTLTTAVENVNDPYQGRSSVDKNGTLVLSKVTEDDSGEYSLSIVDMLGNTRAAEIELRVIVPVSEVKITSNVPEARELNTSVVLTCSAKGSFLRFKWLNDTTAVTGDNSRVKLEKGEAFSKLSFSSVYRSDLVGPLFCEAFNTLSSGKSNAFNLTTHYGPDQVTLTPPAPEFLASDSNFRLTCLAVSSPAATYSWFSDGKQLEAAGPVLTLDLIQKNGLGKTKASYSCKANNAKTEKTVASESVSFTVIEKVSAVSLAGPVGGLFAGGNSSANLSCSVEKGSMQTVNWLKDKVPLASGGRVQFSGNHRSVLIRPLQKEDNGEFICQISNPVSKEQAKVQLTVFYGPEPVVLTGGKEVEITDPVKLECSAASVPPANYTWKFNNTKTAVTTNHYVIDKAAYANTGTYTCEAHNSMTGKSSFKSHFLSVKEEGALDEGLSDGAIAGIVIGVLAAVALAVGLFIYCRQKVPLESPY